MPAPRRLRSLGALALLWTLALQISLPVAHASAHAVFAGSVDTHCAPLELRGTSTAHSESIDPSACPVCQSLHAKPAVMPLAPSAHHTSGGEAAFVATAQRIHADATHRAHAPRAPPLAALSLA